MPSSDPHPDVSPRGWRRWLRPRSATQAWVLLLALTSASVLVALDGRGVLPWVGWVVAALIWLKARLVALHYLELQRAEPVFRRWVSVFSALVPLALVLTALLEAHG